ncbi:MAG: hypothetical protein O2810_03295 [Bacteroidetes bacterium]|nr:hypothetical protein [Bacteroidota bacterium]MDA0888778.1 hypothetical protein [Bacteroidota bacterium]MDA1084540.1 hypothetical protein [Bacteroidota bacterium]
MSLFIVIGCTSPKTKPQAPNINWTAMDEPPLFPDCPKEDVQQNWNCFTDVLQIKLKNRLLSKPMSSLDLIDTLFVTLKVDTIGQLSVMGYSNKNNLSPMVYSSVEEVVASLPKFQPAFKTNLEVPVEVHWILPVAIYKGN